MEHDPRAWIRALRNSHDRLASFVASASAEELARTSMADEWSVAKVLSHLGSGAELSLATVTGTPIENAEVWARWDAKARADMAVGFVESDERLVSWWESRSDGDLATIAVQLPYLPTPVGAVELLGMRLSEISLHSWDVFATFDSSTPIAPEATRLLVDRLPTFLGLLGRFLPRDTRPTRETTTAVTTSEPKRQWDLVLGDGIELRQASGAGNDGTLELPAEAFLRLIAGRLKTGDAGAVATGALSLGDVRNAFPGL